MNTFTATQPATEVDVNEEARRYFEQEVEELTAIMSESEAREYIEYERLMIMRYDS